VRVGPGAGRERGGVAAAGDLADNGHTKPNTRGMLELAELADELGVDARTLRRAAVDGTIHVDVLLRARIAGRLIGSGIAGDQPEPLGSGVQPVTAQNLPDTTKHGRVPGRGTRPNLKDLSNPQLLGTPEDSPD
jgi:hypothetical protein